MPCGRVCAYVAQGTKAHDGDGAARGRSPPTERRRCGERTSRPGRSRDTEKPSLSPSRRSRSLARSLPRSVPLRSLALTPSRSLARSLAYPFSTAKGSCFRFSDATSARSCATTKTTRSASSCRRRPSAVVLVSVLVAVVVLLLFLLPLPLRRRLTLLFRCRSRLVALLGCENAPSPAVPSPAVGQPPRHRVRDGHPRQKLPKA